MALNNTLTAENTALQDGQISTALVPPPPLDAPPLADPSATMSTDPSLVTLIPQPAEQPRPPSHPPQPRAPSMPLVPPLPLPVATPLLQPTFVKAPPPLRHPIVSPSPLPPPPLPPPTFVQAPSPMPVMPAVATPPSDQPAPQTDPSPSRIEQQEQQPMAPRCARLDCDRPRHDLASEWEFDGYCCWRCCHEAPAHGPFCGNRLTKKNKPRRKRNGNVNGIAHDAADGNGIE